MYVQIHENLNATMIFDCTLAMFFCFVFFFLKEEKKMNCGSIDRGQVFIWTNV